MYLYICNIYNIIVHYVQAQFHHTHVSAKMLLLQLLLLLLFEIGCLQQSSLLIIVGGIGGQTPKEVCPALGGGVNAASSEMARLGTCSK